MSDPVELCGVCGAVARPGARFCPRCGARIGAMVHRDVGLAAEPAPVAPHEPAGDPRGLVAALCAYFSFLALIVAGLLWRPADVGSMSVLGLGALGLALVWGAVTFRKMLPLVSRLRLSLRDGVVALAATVALAGVVLLVKSQLPGMFIDDVVVFGYRAAGWGLGRALFDYALLPALGEEILFRGVVLTGLLGVFRPRTAVAVSAMLFATVHLSVLSFVHLSLLGALLGWVRVRSESVYPCIALHVVYNAVILWAAW